MAKGPDDSALRGGQGDFDATGRIPCAQYVGQPMTQWDFGVARADGGYATVVITKPDGMKRAIFSVAASRWAQPPAKRTATVLRKNSAYDHQTLATQIQKIIEASHPATPVVTTQTETEAP